jgi:hypothetical protein
MTRFMFRSDRLVRTAMAVVGLLAAIALLGWSSYFYTVRSFESRDRERLEALSRITSERDAMNSVQERLERELALSNAQLAAAHDLNASLEQQQRVAKKGDVAASESVDASRKTAQKRLPPRS